MNHEAKISHPTQTMNMLLTSGASSESSLASPLIPMVGLLVGKNEAPCELAKPAGLHFLSVVIVSFASCSHIMAARSLQAFSTRLDSTRTERPNTETAGMSTETYGRS